jgi:hypothetical protein
MEWRGEMGDEERLYEYDLALPTMCILRERKRKSEYGEIANDI